MIGATDDELDTALLKCKKDTWCSNGHVFYVLSESRVFVGDGAAVILWRGTRGSGVLMLLTEKCSTIWLWHYANHKRELSVASVVKDKCHRMIISDAFG